MATRWLLLPPAYPRIPPGYLWLYPLLPLAISRYLRLTLATSWLPLATCGYRYPPVTLAYLLATLDYLLATPVSPSYLLATCAYL